MAETYTQCRLRRGTSEQVAWIPSLLAIEGRYVRIKEINGWQIVSKGATMSAEYVREHERDFRHQREASDI